MTSHFRRKNRLRSYAAVPAMLPVLGSVLRLRFAAIPAFVASRKRRDPFWPSFAWHHAACRICGAPPTAPTHKARSCKGPGELTHPDLGQMHTAPLVSPVLRFAYQIRPAPSLLCCPICPGVCCRADTTFAAGLDWERTKRASARFGPSRIFLLVPGRSFKKDG